MNEICVKVFRKQFVQAYSSYVAWGWHGDYLVARKETEADIIEHITRKWYLPEGTYLFVFGQEAGLGPRPARYVNIRHEVTLKIAGL